MDTEKWRRDTKLDETVPIWDYPEKTKVAEYYKQFYHKTDKVDHLCNPRLCYAVLTAFS